MSVRKGVEMVVGLSHRLSDLAGRVRIRVVGDRTVWSDYRCLLEDLNPHIAVYQGGVPPEGLPDVYRAAHGLIQPSHYEPFGLTVAEALASGLPVVASDEVGASEGVDPRCCRTFPAGDLPAFEAAVRQLVDQIAGGAGAELRTLAREEAERLFSPETVVESLTRQLDLRRAVPE
jgi:glycosyltransferase involved in cell wall biosynthesis